jgi:hypothetical protein
MIRPFQLVRVKDLRPARLYLRQADVERYAKMDASTAPPVFVTDGIVNNGCHRLAAAKLRNDEYIRAIVNDTRTGHDTTVARGAPGQRRPIP